MTGAGDLSGGAGRLAQVLASRGGQAAPEAPFVIEHREALIYMLCEAAELEHGILCQYLFAAFSLKASADEGLTEDELAATTRWRRVVSHVAVEEMLHLALVHNLLSAIGAAPHFARPNLPAPASHYPAGVQLALVPFGELALRHFMFLERPEGMQLEDAEGLEAALGHATPLIREGDIVPRGQISPPSGICTARSSTASRIWPRSSASATCSWARRARRRPPRTSTGRSLSP
jgi:hypothetical protein